MTAGELAGRMSSTEFTEWQVFFQVDGWLAERLGKGERPWQALEYAWAMHRILERAGK